MCKKHLTLECFVFSYFPRTVFTFPMFCGQYYWCEDIISDPIFTQMFMWNSSLRNSTYFVPGPLPNISIFDPFVIEVYGNVYSTEEQVVSFTAVFQLHYSYEYANWNSFKNRSKWASVEMYLRRFSTAFRTATVKNTHRWLLPKCSWSSCSWNIRKISGKTNVTESF